MSSHVTSSHIMSCLSISSHITSHHTFLLHPSSPTFFFLTLLFFFSFSSFHSAIVGTLVSIVVVAVVSYTTTMSIKWRSILFNGAFLVVIVCGHGLYFGKKVIDIYATKRSAKTNPSLTRNSRNIEQSFLDMVRKGYGAGGGETDEELLHDLVLLIGMLKKAHSPEAKLRLCNDQVTSWKSMLMLISDDLVSSSCSSSPYKIGSNDEIENNDENEETKT